MNDTKPILPTLTEAMLWEMRDMRGPRDHAELLDTDALFAFCARRNLFADLSLKDNGAGYEAMIRRRAGKQKRHMAWGYASTPYDALGMALVKALRPDRICESCFGTAQRFANGTPCPGCGGTGLKPKDE